MLAVNIFNFDSLSAFARELGGAARPAIAQLSARLFKTHSPSTVVDWRKALGNHSLWLHLDHCEDVDLLVECASAGFDSVMFDGSGLNFSENIECSRRALRKEKRARPDVLVECEIGHVAGVEDGTGSAERRGGIPQLSEVLDYQRQVRPDLLAVGFGNMHGHYHGNEFFDLTLMRDVGHALPEVPLVLHGGSGMKMSIVRQLVGWGHCKINISTDLKVSWMESLRRAGNAGSPLEACEQISRELAAFFRGLKRKYASVLSV